MTDRIEDQVINLPSATPVIDGAHGFATKLLDAQRDFVAEVFELIRPAPAKPAPAKPAPAKKAPAKKAPVKKAAAKKAPARKAAAKRTKKAA